MNYCIKRQNGVVWIEFPILQQFKELVHFSTTRLGGVSAVPQATLNMGFVKSDIALNVIENRKKLAKVLDIDFENFVFSRQTHSNNIVLLDNNDKGKGLWSKETAIPDNDGYLINTKGICPVVLTADCVPIFLYEPQAKIASIVHSGWRGTAKQIVVNSVQKMQQLGAVLSKIIVVIGPSAGPCCYHVGHDVYDSFHKVYKNNTSKLFTEKGTLNLWEAIRLSVLNIGLKEENINIAGLCTICNPALFFSARNTFGLTGRMASGIMIKY